MEIAVDTSSILFGYENKIDIFDVLKLMGYRPIISEGVIMELEKMASSSSRKRGYAKLALEKIKKKDIGLEESKEYVDDWLKKKAMEMPVCTNDTKLKRALKEKGAKVFTLARNGKIR
ncbi:MAG: PIN domain-containing protein [Candidatus Micrarchaeia archaeon]